MPPSVKDDARFFVNVLQDPAFRRDGFLFGQEPGIGRACHWCVIDPNRHEYRVWHKPARDTYFVAAATTLGATAFSNGPYFRYPEVKDYWDGLRYLAHGYTREQRAREIDSLLDVYKQRGPVSPYWMLAVNQLLGNTSAASSVANAFLDLVGNTAHRSPRETKAWNDTMVEFFQGQPGGVVVKSGTTIYQPKQVSQKLNSKGAITNGVFSRSGTSFKDYAVTKDAPPQGAVEAMGGVAVALMNSEGHGVAMAAGEGTDQWVFWGLAELSPAVPPFDDGQFGVVERALKAYQAAPRARGAVGGLVFGLFGQADNLELRQAMLRIGVRDAVCLDTSDSALFGTQGTVLWGKEMSQRKLISQYWGMAFFPIG